MQNYFASPVKEDFAKKRSLHSGKNYGSDRFFLTLSGRRNFIVSARSYKER